MRGALQTLLIASYVLLSHQDIVSPDECSEDFGWLDWIDIWWHMMTLGEIRETASPMDLTRLLLVMAYPSRKLDVVGFEDKWAGCTGMSTVDARAIFTILAHGDEGPSSGRAPGRSGLANSGLQRPRRPGMPLADYNTPDVLMPQLDVMDFWNNYISPGQAGASVTKSQFRDAWIKILLDLPNLGCPMGRPNCFSRLGMIFY